MEYFNSINSFFSSNIDFKEHNFREVIGYSIFNLILWLTIPNLQLKYKAVSRLFSDNLSTAADVVAFVLINVGSMRNYYFIEALKNQPSYDFGWCNMAAVIFGYMLAAFGFVLLIGAFIRLGLRGLYFGDHFGFLFKEKVTEWPYNWFDHPQHLGTSFFFFGMSLAYCSPAGLLISMFILLTYYFVEYIEVKKLALFYP